MQLEFLVIQEKIKVIQLLEEKKHDLLDLLVEKMSEKLVKKENEQYMI
jgi:hypothetical protein